MVVVEEENPVHTFSDNRVLKVAAMMDYAKTIRNTAYRFDAKTVDPNTFFDVYRTRNKLINISRLIQEDIFTDEVGVLEKYLYILGEEVPLRTYLIDLLVADDEVLPLNPERPLKNHIQNLLEELRLSLEELPAGALAIHDFQFSQKPEAALIALLDESASLHFADNPNRSYPLVDRKDMDEILTETEFSLSDLVDGDTAPEIGSMLAARYMIMGSIFEATDSVIIFGRLIDIQYGSIESAAEIVVPREAIQDLL